MTPFTDSTWLVYAHVIARWQFTMQNGAAIQPGGQGATLDMLSTAAPRWDGSGWSVTLHLDGGAPDVCGAGLAPTLQGRQPIPTDGTFLESQAHAPNLAEGCAAAIAPVIWDGTSGRPVSPASFPPGTALFIYRFGVVLAGNDAALRAIPELHVASAHELALASQWFAAGPH